MANSEPEQHWGKPRGMLPNSRFPLLVHRGGVAGGGEQAVLERLRANGWYNNWRWPGIYEYPHFHSTTHECLAVATGWMELEVFGRGGTRIRAEAGDFIVVPAGVSHMMTANSDDVLTVGGYPDGREWDNMQEDHISLVEFREAAKRIMMLPIPLRDPVTGAAMREWIEAPGSVDAGLNEFRDGLNPV